MTRGRLILIEGLDRTGKTTQTNLLLEKLGPNAQLIKFPERTTPIGKLIDKYLTERSFELADQAVHLLFAANRWELSHQIEALLRSGKHVILDRYVYSGVAYSSAKGVRGMDLQWCIQPEKGLIKPDLTLFFTTDTAAERQGFGDERYEVEEFQKKVKVKFNDVFKMFENPDYRVNHIKILDVGNKTVEDVAAAVWSLVSDHIATNKSTDFMYF
ncbi:HFL269Cp [Eremothecium sinecaudum]|uniref:Thymidylate kinase n=1 Tax=Eremothecium sinecaudum TaxID=45286 RepID=A0A120K2I1_9SACH|nr:HFL269Cp [Eremothecium sinecaudum]AMD21587.1 HFL269Cp [Eremothecium sinecaudum]